MKCLDKHSPRAFWLRAYKLARQPDLLLAGPKVIDFPVHYLLYALKATGFELGSGMGFKYFEREIISK